MSQRSIAVFAAAVALALGSLSAHAQTAPASKAGPVNSGPGKPATKSDPVKLLLPPPPSKPGPLLPDAFAGWVVDGAMQTVTDAAQADSANAEALREYDFTHGLLATYKRGGQTLTVHALGFLDASGAYGAYSFYRHNNWPKEQIGNGATSDHNRVLFWVGNTVVDANFSEITPMSAAEMRELAGQIPVPQGNRSLTPPILYNLPQATLEKQTAHYALGPAAYVASGGVLPPALVGFDRGAEALTASYNLPSNEATLTLIDYPTPQMAAAQEQKIRAYIKAGAHAQPAFPKPLADSDQASLEVRRSGPLVIVVSGDAIPEESHRLIESVYFQEDLVNIPQPTEGQTARATRLLFGIAQLIIVGGSAALLLGFFLGGGRALYRRARGKPVSTVYDTEFIRLDLEK
ncbi:MAG TPA: DUF6599 family protein [Terracidiphilus sp.]|nr:DUF6599 family protein [Terracidiphilus sp.]